MTMTREELETCVDIQTKYLWKEGLNVDAARDTIMAAADKYLESQRVSIPAPKLKWEDQGTMLRAKVFNYQFSVVLRTFMDETYWEADVFGTPIRLTEKFDPEDKAGAIAFCESHWESIWTKEVVGVPADDPFAGIDLDCEHVEDLDPSIMDHPVFSAFKHVINVSTQAMNDSDPDRIVAIRTTDGKRMNTQEFQEYLRGVPAADPKILEDALKEVFRIVYGVHVHGEKRARLPFALAYITEQLEKYHSGGKQNG